MYPLKFRLVNEKTKHERSYSEEQVEPEIDNLKSTYTESAHRTYDDQTPSRRPISEGSI